MADKKHRCYTCHKPKANGFYCDSWDEDKQRQVRYWFCYDCHLNSAAWPTLPAALTLTYELDSPAEPAAGLSAWQNSVTVAFQHDPCDPELEADLKAWLAERYDCKALTRAEFDKYYGNLEAQADRELHQSEQGK